MQEKKRGKKEKKRIKMNLKFGTQNKIKQYVSKVNDA